MGFFKQRVYIIGHANNSKVGEITFHNWKTEASLSIHDKVYKWKKDNIWNTKWRISGPEGDEIQYKGSFTSGTIHRNTDDDLLLLSGLYVKNYYLQVAIAIFIAVFIPIIMGH